MPKVNYLTCFRYLFACLTFANVSSPSSSSSLSTSSFVRSLTFFVSPRTLCDGKLLPFVASLSLLSHGPGHVTPPYTRCRYQVQESEESRAKKSYFFHMPSVCPGNYQPMHNWDRLGSAVGGRGILSDSESESDCYCCRECRKS